MPRRSYKRRDVTADPLYHSYEVSKFINYLMLDGKKTVAEKIVYNVLATYEKKGEDPIKVLHTVIHNIAPVMEVRPRRLGGASYLVPIEVRKERRLYLALNWLINAASARPNKEYKTFENKLLAEFDAVLKNEGSAIAKRQQTEKLAETNRAFAHLKW